MITYLNVMQNEYLITQRMMCQHYLCSVRQLGSSLYILWVFFVVKNFQIKKEQLWIWLLNLNILNFALIINNWANNYSIIACFNRLSSSIGKTVTWYLNDIEQMARNGNNITQTGKQTSLKTMGKEGVCFWSF